MDFIPWTEGDRSNLRWVRTKDHPAAFELRSERGVLTSMEWATRSWSLAVARGVDFRWSLKRTGFLYPRVVVRPERATKPLADLHGEGTHHRIRTARGSYRFGRAGLLVPAWEVSGRNGGWALHLEPVREGRRLEGGILELGSAPLELDELRLLAALSWYFIVLAWFEDETIGEWTDHLEGKA
jgi:hypothetical protein